MDVSSESNLHSCQFERSSVFLLCVRLLFSRSVCCCASVHRPCWCAIASVSWTEHMVLWSLSFQCFRWQSSARRIDQVAACASELGGIFRPCEFLHGAGHSCFCVCTHLGKHQSWLVGAMVQRRSCCAVYNRFSRQNSGCTLFSPREPLPELSAELAAPRSCEERHQQLNMFHQLPDFVPSARYFPPPRL